MRFYRASSPNTCNEVTPAELVGVLFVREGQQMTRNRFALHVGFFVLMALVIGFLVVADVRAQDVTDEPIVTVTPVDEVPADPDVPVVIVDSGTPNYGVITVVIVVVVTVGGVVIAAIRAAAKGVPVEQIDADTQRRLQEFQKDRETMDRLEKAYAEGSAALKLALQTTAGVLTVLSPFLTRFGSDDALAGVIKDIQTPGAPDASALAANEPPALG